MDINAHLEEIQKHGITIIKNVINHDLIEILKVELEQARTEDNLNINKTFDEGMVHNCMYRGEEMRRLLDNNILNSLISKLLNSTFIVYAYQSSSLEPGKSNYGSRVHVDTPRFINEHLTNVGVIFPLNDFTKENGATFYLQGSHLKEEIPNDNDFYKKAKRAICKKGDLIVFNARLVHAAGMNTSMTARHSLTINFCRSYMRQRFDFPRMYENEYKELQLTDNMKKRLGWDVRVPKSLKEFYLPEDMRLYKANQG